jgi:hypothetical protein
MGDNGFEVQQCHCEWKRVLLTAVEWPQTT